MTTLAPPRALDDLPFHLTGNYAPVPDEVTLHDLEVRGELPPELNGTYVRNGPNPRHGPTPIWFLGQGMLHAVRLQAGRALWYRNRWVDAPTTSNTHVVRHAGKLMALVETAKPVVVSEDMETLGPFDFAGGLPHGMTAHPKTCPSTGDLLFYTYSLEVPFLTYYQANPSGELVRSVPIDVGSPTYMHDFAITRRFALFFDLPVLFHGWRKSMPIQWSETYGARIGVVPRDGEPSDVRWFSIAPCTISHTVNAYEEEDKIVLDVVRGSRLGEPTRLVRYALDLRTGAAHEAELDTLYVDFPRIDDRRTGLPHRHVYALELRDVVNGAPTSSMLRKYDLTTHRSVVHDFGPGRVGGEAIFVPKSENSGEDDGYAITYVYDKNCNASELVVFDASDFEAPALATVTLPRRDPFGIHANWFADAGGATERAHR
jgi:carotenoid cleavage dioxygenase-like enzyme